MSLGLFQSAHAQINLSTGLSISATVASGDSGTGDTGGGTSGGGSSGGGGGGGGSVRWWLMTATGLVSEYGGRPVRRW